MFAGPGANARELAVLDALEGAVKGLRMLPPPALAREPRERRFGRGRQACAETRGMVRGRSIGGTRRHERRQEKYRSSEDCSALKHASGNQVDLARPGALQLRDR